METMVEYLVNHANIAHWVILGLILLAGLNIPISADVVVIGAAFLAATAVPEKRVFLFFTVYIALILSAWIAYWLGRLLGEGLASRRGFKKLLRPERMERITAFYTRYGFRTLLIGRFIPFGVRNCIFMSTGMSKSSFWKFALSDALACLIWSSLFFTLFYSVGHNYEAVYGHTRTAGIAVLSLTVLIGLVLWLRKRKKMEIRDVDTP